MYVWKLQITTRTYFILQTCSSFSLVVCFCFCLVVMKRIDVHRCVKNEGFFVVGKFWIVEEDDDYSYVVVEMAAAAFLYLHQVCVPHFSFPGGFVDRRFNQFLGGSLQVIVESQSQSLEMNELGSLGVLFFKQAYLSWGPGDNTNGVGVAELLPKAVGCEDQEEILVSESTDMHAGFWSHDRSFDRNWAYGHPEHWVST